MTLNSLDILIMFALSLGVVRGLMTGAVRQIVSLVGTIFAIILAIELMNPVGSIIGSALGLSDGFSPVIGLFVVFAAVQIVVFFVVRAIEAAIKAVKLNTANRAIGGVVGLGKGALILSILFVALAFFDVPERENRDESTLYAPVAGVLPTTWDFVSGRLPQVKSMSDRLGSEAREVLSD